MRSQTTDLWLEIGFGSGEHFCAQASSHPEATHIGVEPYVNGVASCLSQIEAQRLGNVWLAIDDARLLLDRLEPGSLTQISVLFPDPWPKTRHHKRRIVNRDTAHRFADHLEPGGDLRLASDDPSYIAWMLEALALEPRLAWTATSVGDWRERPSDVVATRYEQKALIAGRRCSYLTFQRI
ncbi:MAG: tRNA (guanosine(46)-N7)-methyltransferase TrmB [Geminicoccaceae bacterium]